MVLYHDAKTACSGKIRLLRKMEKREEVVEAVGGIGSKMNVL